MSSTFESQRYSRKVCQSQSDQKTFFFMFSKFHSFLRAYFSHVSTRDSICCHILNFWKYNFSKDLELFFDSICYWFNNNKLLQFGEILSFITLKKSYYARLVDFLKLSSFQTWIFAAVAISFLFNIVLWLKIFDKHLSGYDSLKAKCSLKNLSTKFSKLKNSQENT